MFNSTYGAGWRAGMAECRLVRPGGTRGIKVLLERSNPFPRSRFISRFLWQEGYYAGRRNLLKNWIVGTTNGL